MNRRATVRNARRSSVSHSGSCTSHLAVPRASDRARHAARGNAPFFLYGSVPDDGWRPPPSDPTVGAEEPPVTAERVYAGLTPDERHARRRTQLLDAGLERFAADGWNGTTVAAICRTAGLSPRYLYEHVADREELFLAVVDRIADEVETAIRRAAATRGLDPTTRARLVLAAVVEHLAADPRHVRVALVESLATPRFRARRRELLDRFARLASRLLLAFRDEAGVSRSDARRLEVAGALLTGGLVELLIAWADDDDAPPPTEVFDHLVDLAAAAARP
ncbi:TetR/AcrR family transcriptional regulator [Nitriliruptoraceae bacterium ZYF776]|nr:TetR/AcrR family transcriptional regulator [Profundirhabdus halotolerans]